MSLYTEYKEAMMNIKSNRQAILNSALEELKQFVNLRKFIIIGYTPGFNDGDPCTHKSYSYVTSSYMGEIAECDDSQQLRSFVGVPDDYEGETYKWLYNNEINHLTNEDKHQINPIMSDIKVLLSDLYHTDYMVMVDMTGDTPKIVVNDYDCGY